MGGWAQTVCNRSQVVLFSPTLDDSIMPDHPLRLFEELLAAMDFAEWESRYVLNDGQPPIHPRLMAGVILYGLSVGIRSSRKLEEATGNRLDFIWLCEGREIDHSTPAKFRVKFEHPLKGLFRQIGKVAIGMGLANLNQIALDGTVKRANNSRYATARRASLGEKLLALDEQIEKMLAEAGQADQKEDELYGQSTPGKLPRELRDMKARQERLRAALKKVESMEEKKPQSQPDAAGEEKKNAAEDKGGKAKAVPTTDPDSSIIQNKTGGFAPNYTVVLATEGENGFIMDAQVGQGQ
jgi:transposase